MITKGGVDRRVHVMQRLLNMPSKLFFGIDRLYPFTIELM